MRVVAFLPRALPKSIKITCPAYWLDSSGVATYLKSVQLTVKEQAWQTII